MELTRGEFCQFNLATRLELLKEFGKNVLKKKIHPRLLSVYRIYGFYVEVYENLDNNQLERVEPVRNTRILEVYKAI